MSNTMNDAPMYIHPKQLHAVGFPENQLAIFRRLYPDGTPMTRESLVNMMLSGVDTSVLARFYLAKIDYDNVASTAAAKLSRPQLRHSVGGLGGAIYAYADAVVDAARSTMARGFTSGLPVYFAYDDAPVPQDRQYAVGQAGRIENDQGVVLAFWLVEYSTAYHAGGRIVAVTPDGYKAQNSPQEKR